MKACSLAPGPPPPAESPDGDAGALARSALAVVSLLGITGCKSMAKWSEEPVPVSVSAANYSQLSDEELYARVHDPTNAPTGAPAVPSPAKPLYYLLLPGEVYPSDVPLDAVYRELEIPLEQRGYFNADYQTKAGHPPPRVDYLLRVHYGERLWLNPTVRWDKVTWGDDGLLADRYKTNLISDTSFDPRVGLSPSEVAGLQRLFGSLMAGGSAGPSSLSTRLNGGMTTHDFGSDQRLWREFGEIGQASSNFYLVVVEAFRFDDVMAKNNRAPCVWAVFIAVPVESGQKFSGVIRAMLQTATPYFGETTHGVQVYEVPPGKVRIGAPFEVPDSQKAAQP